MDFNEVISWLIAPDNALAIAQVFAAFVTAAATFALWRVTRILAAETADLAAMTSKPFVVGALEASGASPIALNLVLRNTGNAAAFDIQLKLEPALPDFNGYVDPSKTETTKELSLLPPSQALPLQGVMGRDINEVVYSVTVSWAKRPKESDRETLTYSIRAADGFSGG
jgi:hypothetical protein